MDDTGDLPINKVFTKEETTNYCRIILLIVDIGTETLLHLFYSLVPKHTVKGYFSLKILEIIKGKREKIFDKSQYLKLTCRDPIPEEFDISLLIKLMTFFKLTSVNLQSLQIIRNEIVGHKSRGELTKQDFEGLWVKLENILLTIARCVSGDVEKETQLKIEELKQQVLDVSDREKKIIKIFETWCHEKIAVLSDKADRNRNSIENLRVHVTEMTNKIQQDIQHLVVLAEKQTEKEETILSAEEWNNCKMLQSDLTIYYRDLLSELQISPLFEEEGYALKFFDLYVKPIVTIPNQKPADLSQSRPIHTLHDIFVRNSKPCQKIYIKSAAGCGKTSFLKYLTLVWCQAHLPFESDNQWLIEDDINEMRTFMLLFLIYLRESHERECDVDRMIQNQLLCRLANSDKYANSDFLQKLLSNVKCIVLLDGLDEWNHPLEHCSWPNKQIPHSRTRTLCTTLTTSRPWKLDVVGLKSGEIDQKLELNGLEGDLLDKLIQKAIKHMNDLHGNGKIAELFQQELDNNKLRALSKIPIVVMQLLTLWYDSKPFGKSQCEIYTNMVEFLFERNFKKRHDCLEKENNKVEGRSNDQQIPVCFQSITHCKTHMDLLSKLGELALDTLFSDTQESSLVFNVTVVKNYISDKELTKCLELGILTQEKVNGIMSERRSNVSFLHKTFQEFLTALYITINPGNWMAILEKVKYKCCSIEKILEMSQIFMFLSGLCPEVMSLIFEHVRDTVSADSGTKDYRASCEMSPWWSREGQTLGRVQYTMEEWLAESWLNGHKHATYVPVSDFFILSGSRWSAEFKSIIVQNPVCSLFILGDSHSVSGEDYSPEIIAEILKSVTVFNSIQKLWLSAVSKSFVFQLVSWLKDRLNVEPYTWRNLRCVTLVKVDGISGDILCSLVDFILRVPKSVKVRLLVCSISKGTKDWKAYIRSNPLLIVDDDDIVDNDYCDFWRNVNLLQFHTNKI